MEATVSYEFGKGGTEVKAKGTLDKLPKVKTAIIGRADVNSYGRGENAGKMVGNKFQIFIKLGEDWGEFKAGDKMPANTILYKMGVKTFPVFTDWEKAKKACKRVEKWGREIVKVQKATVTKVTKKAMEEEMEKMRKEMEEMRKQLELKKAIA